MFFNKAQYISMSISYFIIFVIVVLFIPVPAFAAMSSTTYRIDADSLNFGGTDTGASTSYRVLDTAGEAGTGGLSSSSYQLGAGYRAMAAEPVFQFSLSANSIAFGVLSTGAVFTGSVTVTTTTNATNGYITTIVEDGNFRTSGGAVMTDVADGTVTAGSEEYGIRTSGTDGQMNSSDTAITSTAQSIASYSTFGSNRAVVVTFKVAISNITEAGNYQHLATLISTGTY